MTPLFDQHSLERWFDHFQSKAENKILVLLQAGGELIRQPVNIKGVGLQKKSHCLILVVMYW